MPPGDVARLLTAIGAFGLPGARADALPDGGAISPRTWERLTDLLRRRRLSGLAVAAHGAGVLQLSEDQRAALAQLDRDAQGLSVRSERLTLELTAELAAAGVPTIVLKGPVTARQAYAEVAWRPFVDVDLLVRGDDLDATVQRLERAGAARLVPALRPGFDRRFAKSVTLRHPCGVEVDLHRTLVVGPLGQLVEVEDLWSGRREVELVAGRGVHALHPDLAFLHACLHISAGGALGILPARDVIGLAGDADLDRCAGLARRWQATAVVRAGLAAAAMDDLPVPADLAAWARALAPSAGEQRVLRAYRAREARRMAAASLRYVRGIRGKVAYARALALPSADNRSARQRSWLGHAGRMLGLGRRRRT